MEALVWLLVFPYMCIGYLIGMAANNLYLDDRPSEELTLPNRLARLLFFPASYHNWPQRSIGGESEVGLGLRTMAEAHFRRDTPPTPEQLQSYCRLTSVVWPMKLITVPFFLIQVIVLLCFMPFSYVGRLAENTTTKLVSLLFGSKDMQDEMEKKINSIKDFLEKELSEYFAGLQEKEKRFAGRRNKILHQIEEWTKIRGEALDQNLPTDRIDLVLMNLRQHQKETETSEMKSREATKFIEQKKRELEFLVRMLRRYQETSSLLLSINSEIDLDLDEGIKTKLDSANEIITVCREVYTLDSKLLPIRPKTSDLASEEWQKPEMQANQTPQASLPSIH